MASTAPENTADPYVAGGEMMGAYLTYKEANGGTLYMHWSQKEVVDGALCYVKPGKTVPRFKFNNSAGRSQISSSCDEKTKFFTTYAVWLKECYKDWDGECIVMLGQLDQREAQIVFLTRDNKVLRINGTDGEPKTKFNINPAELQAVAVVSALEKRFLVHTMAHNLFMDSAKEVGGGAVSFNR